MVDKLYPPPLARGWPCLPPQWEDVLLSLMTVTLEWTRSSRPRRRIRSHMMDLSVPRVPWGVLHLRRHPPRLWEEGRAKAKFKSKYKNLMALRAAS